MGLRAKSLLERFVCHAFCSRLHAHSESQFSEKLNVRPAPCHVNVPVKGSKW
jgi:hypothetical protein